MADAREANSSAGDVPGAMERLAFLDDWIGQRIAAAEAAEGRLARRLEAVEKAEAGLGGLLEALRKQTGQSCSILAQITEFQASGQRQAREILDSFQASLRSQIEAATATVWARTGEFEERCGIFEDWLGEQLRLGTQAIFEHSRERVEAAKTQVAEAAGELAGHMERKLAMYQKGAGDLAAIVEETLRRGMDQLHHQAEEAAEEVAKEVEGRLVERIQGMRLQLHDQALSMRRELGQWIDRMIGDARGVVALHEAQLSRRVEGIRPRISAAIKQVEGEVAAALSEMTAEAERQGLWIEKRTCERTSEAAGMGRPAVEVEVFLNREQRIKEDAA